VPARAHRYSLGPGREFRLGRARPVSNVGVTQLLDAVSSDNMALHTNR